MSDCTNSCSCTKCKITIITKKGEKGDKGDKGDTGDTGTEAPLTWVALAPFLVNTWFNAGGQPGEYAVDLVKKLIYIRGNIGFTGTPGSSIVFEIPFATLGFTTTYLSYSICYEYANGVVAQVRIGEITASSFCFRYEGGADNPVLSLDSVPLIRKNS